MIPPHVVRVLASVRVPSSYGPDVDYELVHAVVSSGADHKATHESVLLRLTVGNAAKNDRAAEILVQDLPAVSQQWQRFVTDVLYRRAQAGDAEAQAALDKMQKANAPPPVTVLAAPMASGGGMVPAPAPIVISPSGGRFGPKGKPDSPSGTPTPQPEMSPIISMGPKKASGRPVGTAEGPPTPPVSPSPIGETRSRQFVPDKYTVIGFNLSAPPTADGLMRPLQAHPDHLIVVAPMPVAKKAEDFIQQLKAGRIKGRPQDFEPIVVRRTVPEGPVPTKKLRAELAGGIARMLGDPNSALWILPE